MKHIRKGIALGCVLAFMLQLFVAFPAASADTGTEMRLTIIIRDSRYASSFFMVHISFDLIILRHSGWNRMLSAAGSLSQLRSYSGA